MAPLNKFMNSHGIILEVSGDYALFSRPEMKVERVSYDVITPSAARGILEAIYWKPQIVWRIDRLHVLKPIRFTNIRRNELSSKIPVKGSAGVNAAMASGKGNLGISINEVDDDGKLKHRQQRAALLLTDVRYVIEAHFDILDSRLERGGPIQSEQENAGKHRDIFTRRARSGQYFHQPYFGCREFPVRFRLIEPDEPLPARHESLCGKQDLGFMLHDIEFDQDPRTKEVKSSTSHFFHALMDNGVIAVPPLKFQASSNR
jgi:CRISPR-associated protein Cas5d